ncbi:MAG: ComF family protein [Chloroflexota bacterium]
MPAEALADTERPTGWRKWAEAFLDLILPRRCAGCGAIGTWLCAACASKLPRVMPPICQRCGAPTPGTAVCFVCWQSPPSAEAIRAPYYFEGTLRLMVHRLKYRHARHLAEPLGRLLVDYLETRPVPPVDLVVPIPLHPNRLEQRGYNQSLLLAKAVCDHTSLRLVDDCLARVRDTPAQMGLPAHQRPANVRGAFQASRKQVAGAKVLLVDDVCTTGATLQAGAHALKRAGAEGVWAVALARARPPSPSTNSPATG